MVETFTRTLTMLLQLNDSDLAKMPPNLSSALLNWLQSERLFNRQIKKPQSKPDTEQLFLTLVDSEREKQHSCPSSNSITLTQESKLTAKPESHAHVRLTQLFAAGITKTGMPVRVRLKQELVKKHGHEYVTKGLSLSSKGTVLYQGEEFDKPSPLAARVNGSSTNGWEYIEVLRSGQWICLDKLRKIWRAAS